MSNKMTYKGSFRLPYGPGSDDNFSYGGKLSWHNGLVVHGRAGRYAKVTTPVGEIATCESFASPPTLPASLDSFGGMWTDGTNTLSTGYVYYDANNTARVGHNFNGQWRTVWQADKQGLVAGYMCSVPAKWRAQLGDVITGLTGVPIITRTSYGPAAFGLKLADFAQPGIVPAKPLVYYTAEHATLGVYPGVGEVFNDAMKIAGVAIVGDELIFAGTIGTGEPCYGSGTSDPTLHNKTVGDEHFCYDPESTDKGGHRYPYRYQLWVYDIPTLLAAQNPWDVVPTVEVLPDMLPGPTKMAGFIAAPDGTLYVAQAVAENNSRVGGYPIVHVYQRATAVVEPPADDVAQLKAEIAALHDEIAGYEEQLFKLTSGIQTIYNRLLPLKSTAKWLLTDLKDLL